MKTLVRSIRLTAEQLAWMRQAAEAAGLNARNDAEVLRFTMFAGLDRLTNARWRTGQPPQHHLAALAARPTGRTRDDELLERLGHTPPKAADVASRSACEAPQSEAAARGRAAAAQALATPDDPDTIGISRLLRIPTQDPRGTAWSRDRWDGYAEFLHGIIEACSTAAPAEGGGYGDSVAPGVNLTQLIIIKETLRAIEQDTETFLSDPKTLLDNYEALCYS